MTTTHVVMSTDPGMPVLSGTAGTLLAVLDAALINGGTPQSVTSITRSGQTATATKAAHGLRNGAVVLNAGANEAEYNGKFKITVLDANTYTFTVTGSPASPATGSPTVAMAAPGWTKPFAGTNKAVYRAPQGNRNYLRVVDDGSEGTYGAKVAQIRAYEVMTDVDTGTGDFPSVAQLANALWVGKSSTFDTVARFWIVASDEKRAIILSAYNAANPDSCSTVFFGDLVDINPSDAYASFIHGCVSAASANGASPGGSNGQGNLCISGASSGNYLQRKMSGVAGSCPSLNGMRATSSTGSGSTTYTGAFPNGDYNVEKVFPTDGVASTDAPRGAVPGLRYCPHDLTAVGYTTGTMVGSLMLIKYSSSIKAFFLDTANWE